MRASGRLVEACISLKDFSYNISAIRSLLKPGTKIMAVVKGNAYGHGIVPIAQAAEKLKVDYFGVVCLYEGRMLREAGVITPILLLNYTDSQSLEEAVDLNLTLNVMDDDVLRSLSMIVSKKQKEVSVHVKVDTGMHRIGVPAVGAADFITRVVATEGVRFEGVFTHFADADGDDLSFTYQQLAVFNSLLKNLESKGIRPQIVHAANSAAILRVPESHFSMVRPGKILYGPLSMADADSLPFLSRQIMTLKTRVVQMRTVEKGESVGYGRAFIAGSKRIIAALPIGYADGFRRAPKNFGEVLIRGCRAPLVGRVSMDQSSIDITEIPGVEVGDEVIILGKQGDDSITEQEIAEKIGTIGYEVMTSLAERVTRVYKQ